MFAALIVTALLFDTLATPAPATQPSPIVVHCRTAHVVLAEPLDSGTAYVGQTVMFTVTDVDPSSGVGPTVNAGATGYGVVTLARKADHGGLPGAITIESRFIIAPDGAHVPSAISDPSSAHFEGKANNAPAALGFLPFVSVVSSNYNAIHRGGEAHVATTYRLRVTVGDDAVTGACVVFPDAPMTAAK